MFDSLTSFDSSVTTSNVNEYDVYDYDLQTGWLPEWVVNKERTTLVTTFFCRLILYFHDLSTSFVLWWLTERVMTLVTFVCY